MLRPRKKLYKREIKEDSLVTAYFKAQQWFHKNGDRALMAVGGVVVILAVVFFVGKSKRASEAAAEGKLGTAEFAYYSGQLNEQTLKELQAVVDGYSGTKSAGIAAFDLANAYFMQKNYATAEKYYDKVVDDYNDDPLVSASSLSGLAACKESQNQFAEAAKLYAKAQKSFPKLFTAPQALADAARCLILAGDAAGAKIAYQSIIDDYPDSPVASEAKTRMAAL
jgi:TolA-binding protein